MTEHYTRPDVKALLDFINAQEGPRIHQVSAPEARQLFQLTCQMTELPVGELAVMRDISIPGPAGDIPARIFDAQPERDAGPVMVFYHGGGFVIGDIDTYASYCAEVARQLDMPVISIDYRLAPEHPFPASSEDCEAATRWIASSPAELGYKVTALITSGDSAGGNLTIATTMALRDNPADVPVVLQHPIYPAPASHLEWQSMNDFGDGYFLTMDSINWFAEAYCADTSTFMAAPLDFDQSGMPPTLVTTASLDPLSDQGIAYYEKLLASGVKAQHISADGNIHGHITMRKAIPSSQEDVSRNMDALKTMLAGILEPV